jgi:hopanoid biosynthesis associated protein HpnK
LNRGDRRLVVTADDFGAADAVNEAVEQAHRRGVLTAASLMVGAPACADAVDRARRLPSLAVGLHVVLVDGRPVLDPADVPDLVDGEGMFRTDMAALGAAIFFGPAARRQLKAEIRAQFEAFARTGLTLDHVNAHKHFHLHPTILGAILEAGREFGMRALRVPVEPREVLRRAEPDGRAPPALVTGPWAAMARSRVRRAGVRAPDQVFGLSWSGAMTAPRLAALMRRLPEGLSEIYLHPAARNAYEGSAPGYRYVEEFQALLDGQVIEAARSSGAALGGFAEFV